MHIIRNCSVLVKTCYNAHRGLVTYFTNLKLVHPAVNVVRSVNKLYIKERFHLMGTLQFFALFTITQKRQLVNSRLQRRFEATRQ